LQVVKFFAPTPVANGEEGVHFTTNRRGITFTLATAYLVTVTVTPTDALTPDMEKVNKVPRAAIYKSEDFCKNTCKCYQENHACIVFIAFCTL